MPNWYTSVHNFISTSAARPAMQALPSQNPFVNKHLPITKSAKKELCRTHSDIEAEYVCFTCKLDDDSPQMLCRSCFSDDHFRHAGGTWTKWADEQIKELSSSMKNDVKIVQAVIQSMEKSQEMLKNPLVQHQIQFFKDLVGKSKNPSVTTDEERVLIKAHLQNALSNLRKAIEGMKLLKDIYAESLPHNLKNESTQYGSSSSLSTTSAQSLTPSVRQSESQP